jgi:PAS domain S-box-containing protein
MYGAEIVRAARIACEEINERGGVLGRPLELVVEDDGSLPESAVAAAETLVERHGCTAIIGNLLSNSRISVAYRVAEPRRVPYLNFSFYEGSILSRYFFHFAALPNQQIDRMIPYMREKFGGRTFFAGNNYEWPRGSIGAAKRALHGVNGEIVGEEYFPLGVDTAAIDSLLDRIEAARPDVFVPYFAGIDQRQLLIGFTERGLKARMAVVMDHYDEMMASGLLPEVREGFYSSNTYFMSVDTAANRGFLSRLAAYPGVTGLWPRGDGILTNFGEGAYVCVNAFAQAANEAGSLDAEALVDALRTVRIEAPQGLVSMDPDTQHATVNTYLARCGADGVFTVIESFGAIAPGLPAGYHHQRIGTATTLEDDIRLQGRMLAHLSEGVLLVRAADGVIVYNNAGAERLLGYDAGELLDLPISRLDDPSNHDPDHSCVELMRVLARKGAWQGEIAGAGKDGTPFVCAVSASAFTHPFFGEVWLLVCRDITAQRQRRAALEALSVLPRATGDEYFTQLAAKLAEILGVAVGFVGTLSHDRSRVRMKGFAVDGHVREPLEFALAGTPCQRVIAGHTTVVSLRDYPEFAATVAPGAGSYAATPLMGSTGSVVGSIGVMSRADLADSEGLRDILKLFAVQAAVELERRRAEARFIAVFEFAPDAIVISDREGRVRQVNQEAERIFGWTRAEIVGQPVEVLMRHALRRQHVGQREQFLHQRVARGMGMDRPDLRALRKDGTEFPVEIALAPIEMEGDLLVAAAIRDISTRVMLEEQFRQSQKMESVGQLAAGIAHDFNNLLTVINGLAELASEEVPVDAPVGQKLATIRDAGGRAAELTRQLLAFSRKQILRPSVVSLNRVVVQAEALLRRVLGEHIRLSVHMQADVSLVTVDPGQFQQVIMNLAINSRDAMPKGGTLTIRTENATVEATTENTRGLPPGCYAMLEIRDTGTGMDAATLARIFEPFFTTKPQGQGTGLGLATVYGIVKQSGGYVYVQSTVGEGTSFKVYLPASDVAASEREAERVPPVSRGTESVLVVDDDTGVKEVMKRMLEKAGYTVFVADGPEDALQRLDAYEDRIDLLLTDVVMPGLGGWELAEHIRARRPGIKVLFTSGYTDDALLQRGVLEKDVHLINKPYSAGELARKVRDVLGS